MLLATQNEKPMPFALNTTNTMETVAPNAPTMGTDDISNIERPTLDQSSSPPKMIRSQEHLNMAQTKHVEGKKATSTVSAKHLVKIFSGDGDEFVEVSPEQVERVKTSK